MTKLNTTPHQWTKIEIKTLVSLWDTKSPDDIAQELNLTRAQVMYMVGEVRKVNPVILSKKRRRAELRSLITEALSEI